MQQSEACNDVILGQLADALDRDPHDRVAALAFDDRCMELGVGQGGAISRTLFRLACRLSYRTKDVAQLRGEG